MTTVGVIGTGYIGPIHLGALSRIEGVKVKAVCDVNPVLAEGAAKNYNIERSCSNYEEILGDDDIEVIHNCTPNKHHYRITKEALERGKHVLSEKPLAMTLGEAGELVDLAEKKGVVTGVHFCYRRYPVVQEMAVRIRRGDLGDVRTATGSYFQDWLSNGAPGSFTTSQACAGRKSDTEFQIYGSRCSMAWNHARSTELWIGHRDRPNETLIEGPGLQDSTTARYATLPGGHPLGYHVAAHLRDGVRGDEDTRRGRAEP